MKKIILFSSIACALTACGGDGADPVPRTEPPAVSGKLTYTDESGKVVGELRGEQLAELELIATDNRAVSGLSVQSVQPNKDFPDDALLNVFLLDQVAPDRPNEYRASLLIQGVSNNLVGLNDCFIFPRTDDCDSNSRLTIEPEKGVIKWEQNKAKTLKKGTGNLSEKDYVSPEYFYVSGSLTSKIPPTNLIFKKDRFPVQSINSSLNDSLMGAIQPKEIYAYYEDTGTIALPISQRRLRLAVGNTELVLDAENQKIISYVNTAKIPTLIQLPDGTTMPVDPVIALSDWNCVENCGYELATIGNQRRITLNNAVLQHKQNYLQRLTLMGAVEFAPHQAQLSLKQESINTEYSFVSSIVRNNTAIYTSILPVPRTASTCNNGKQIAIKRENQTIKSVEVTCDHWHSVTKTNVQTVFGVCGLPNAPTCTGASLSADGHTFTFVKTKLSNNEELNGTLYFAGVAAAESTATN